MGIPARKIKYVEEEKKHVRAEKKFGLVWEDGEESVAKKCKTNLPLLKEVKTKKIITDIDKPTNIIIEGDNYHALSVLNYTHNGKIDVIYIDPPYNSGKADWKYNNNYVDKEDSYRHSKWLSFMSKRLILAKKLLKENGVLICAIDYREKCRLGLLLEEIFPIREKDCITIVHNPRGKQSDSFSYVHEYAFFVYPKGKGIIQEKARDEDISNFRNWGGESLRTDAKNCFYPIIVREKSNGNITIEKIGQVSPKNFHPQKQAIHLGDKRYEIYPIDKNGKERKWRYSVDGVNRVINSLKVFKAQNERIEIKISKTKEKYKTVWNDKKFDANEYGTKLVSQIINKEFPFPKSLYTVKECLKATCENNRDAIILDFFAGSGTTGHAVLEMNKQDGGNRQFILCTNNENNICEEVTYPRIKNVITGYKCEEETKKVLFKEKININFLKKSKDILCKVEDVKNKYKNKYDKFENKFESNFLKLVGVKNIQDKEGLGGNIRYFQTTFIPYSVKPTDSTKAQIMKNATDVLCIKENAFEEVISKEGYRIFKSCFIYMGILFDSLQFFKFKNEIKKLSKKKCRIYIFSFVGDDKFEKSFDDLKNIKIVSVPEVILRVYKRLFLRR